MLKARKGADTTRLLRVKRCQTPAKFKAKIREVVGMHLLGLAPFIAYSSVKKELEAADLDPEAGWGRQRLGYQFKARKKRCWQRYAGSAPWRTRRLLAILPRASRQTFFDLEDAPAPAAADVNPLGGRPLGTIVAASRVVKKMTSLIHVIL